MSNPKDVIAQKLPSKEELKEDVKVATKSSMQSLRALIAGGVGGVCAVVVGHPFDLVKVRLQTSEKGVYTGAMDVVRKTIAKEGLARGLYAGVSAPLVGVTPMCKSTFSQTWRWQHYRRRDTNLPQSPFPSGDTMSASSSSRAFRPSKTTSTASHKFQPPASSVPSP
jgi:hypothetical protein